MARRRSQQISGVLADLGAGLSALFGALKAGLRLTGKAVGRGLAGKRFAPRFRLPTWRLVGVAAGSAIMWSSVALLIINIRFAAMVLPTEPGDLYAANRPVSLTILDRNGELIGSRGSIYRDPVPLEDIPDVFLDAIIATEDRRFYKHYGFDIRGLARALVANARAGGVVEGGSTLTQQLAKNVFLTPDKTLIRKLEEIQLAVWLEARYSKEQILSLYVNRVYMGAGAYGLEAAANVYFDKPAKDLTFNEAVILAGLPQAPSSYAPHRHWDRAVARSHAVIDNLVEAGKLSAEDAAAAKLTPPELAVSEVPEGFGYFLDYVLAELNERFGELDEDLVVQTTLDSRLQKIAEKAVSDALTDDVIAKGASQAGLIAYDADGQLVAMVGGLDYGESQFNRTSQAKRQPGSAFKPFVFLAALEAGLTPETVLVDQPVSVGEWTPTNYSKNHRGPMRLATAVALSTNSVAVQVTEAIGRDRVIDAARRVGVEVALPPVPSLALGSLEITLEELTAAYLPFAHRGAEVPGHAITSVTTLDGRDLGTFSQPIDNYSIIDPGLADETTRMLLHVVDAGTGKGAQFGNWEAAGKTGTTNDWRDAWFVGFTKHLTTGVWVGDDNNQSMDEVTGGSVPLTIWRNFMAAAHADLTPIPLLEDQTTSLRDVAELKNFYSSVRSDLLDVMYSPGAGSWAQTTEGYQIGSGQRSDETTEQRPRRKRRWFWQRNRDNQDQNAPRATVTGRPAPGTPQRGTVTGAEGIDPTNSRAGGSGVVGQAAPGVAQPSENDAQSSSE